MGLRGCGAFFSCAEFGSYFFVAVLGLLIMAACCQAWALGGTGFSSCGSRALGADSVVVVLGLTLLKACGFLMAEGIEPAALHWQADS